MKPSSTPPQVLDRYLVFLSLAWRLLPIKCTTFPGEGFYPSAMRCSRGAGNKKEAC
jgi:hypothetical protein